MLRTITLTRVLLFLPWFVLLGWLTAVSWFLTDDAFISFRYIRNFLEGHGLVFNPGEYVEGYSNFLWILELAAIWGIFGIRPEHAAHPLSIAYTVGTFVAMLWWIARSPSQHDRGLLAWMSVGLLCTSATFAVWTSGGGLETRQFTFFVLLAVVCLAVHNDSRWGLLVASLSLAAAAYTRPEGPLIAGCCFAWFAAQRFIANRRLDWRELAFLIVPCTILVAAHFLFRYAYYGELLPNTYYAKHVRSWYESGFRYLVAAALETGLYLLLPLAYLALRVRWRIYRDSIYGLVLLCLGAHMAYILRIGGDHFEFRPLDFYWPLLAPPAAEGIAQFGSVVSARLQQFRSQRWHLNPRVCAILLFVPVVFYSSSIQAVVLFEGAAMMAREPVGRLYVDLDEENAGWLLSAPLMPVFIAISNDMRRETGEQSVGVRITEHRHVANDRIGKWKPYEEPSRGVIPEDALMVTDGVGIQPYYVPDLKIIDFHGLTDATVARNPVTHEDHERQMAHDRSPPPGYLEQRGVNFVLHPPAPGESLALDLASYALKLGPGLWMPFEANDLQWVVERFDHRDLRIAGFMGVTSVGSVLEDGYSVSMSQGKETISTPDGEIIPVIPGAVEGTVDHGRAASWKSGLRMAFISGWAADVEQSRPAREVLLLANGRVIYAIPLVFKREDVAGHFGKDNLVRSGFGLMFPQTSLGDPESAEVRVLGVSSDGVASELIYSEEFEWSN